MGQMGMRFAANNTCKYIVYGKYNPRFNNYYNFDFYTTDSI